MPIKPTSIFSSLTSKNMIIIGIGTIIGVSLVLIIIFSFFKDYLKSEDPNCRSSVCKNNFLQDKHLLVQYMNEYCDLESVMLRYQNKPIDKKDMDKLLECVLDSGNFNKTCPPCCRQICEDNISAQITTMKNIMNH